MTALLDTPLPHLHPPTRDGSVSFAGSTAAAARCAAAQTIEAPVRPASPSAVHRVSQRPPRARGGPSATAACSQGRYVGGLQTSTALEGGAPLRLTRRARLLVTVLFALSLLGVVGLAAWNAEPAAGGLQDAPASVVVQSGDTLWQIAADVAPSEDPAVVVELLRSANDLDAAAVQPGQVLVIPRG